MNDDTMHLLSLALAWIAYGVIHSIGASLWFKQKVNARWPAAVRAYRLTYNLLALLLLAVPLWLLVTYPGGKLWHFPAALRWGADTVALLGVIGFVYSARYYDTAEFLGLQQWRTGKTGECGQPRLSLSWLHRFVRHPWYFFGLLILWTREPNAALLISNLAITAYLAVGSRLEEDKLIALHGDRYRSYRRKVPGLFPLPWRFLTRAEAEALMRAQE